jgi:hypothetical protein
MKVSTPRRYPDELAPWRALAAAVVIQALQEAKRNRPCRCKPNEPHCCGERARAFLRSEGCVGLLQALGLPLQKWPAVLAGLEQLDRLDTKRSPRFNARRLKHPPAKGPGHRTGFDGLFPRRKRKKGELPIT